VRRNVDACSILKNIIRDTAQTTSIVVIGCAKWTNSYTKTITQIIPWITLYTSVIHYFTAMRRRVDTCSILKNIIYNAGLATACIRVIGCTKRTDGQTNFVAQVISLITQKTTFVRYFSTIGNSIDTYAILESVISNTGQTQSSIGVISRTESANGHTKTVTQIIPWITLHTTVIHYFAAVRRRVDACSILKNVIRDTAQTTSIIVIGCTKWTNSYTKTITQIVPWITLHTNVIYNFAAVRRRVDACSILKDVICNAGPATACVGVIGCTERTDGQTNSIA